MRLILLLLGILAFTSARSIGSARPDVVLNHLTIGNWNTYALYFYNSQASKSISSLRKTVQRVLEQDEYYHVYYGEVDCKYDGCDKIF
jgi:hypothetical protein